MFGKRKGKEPAQQPDVRKPSGPQTPGGAGKLTTVIVPRSTIEKAGEPGDYALIQGVINFVNGMMQQGLYARFELIDKALQAFHSDFYLAQVLNGGHSQFIHNCFQNLPIVIEDVRAGLTAMNARAHLAIFEQAAAWIIANPEEVKKQTGFEGGRAPLLDELDTQFYKANKEQSIIQLSSLWIKSWPELRPVDDADYPEAMRRVVMLNPLRKERLLAASKAWAGVGYERIVDLRSKSMMTANAAFAVEQEAGEGAVVMRSTCERWDATTKAKRRTPFGIRPLMLPRLAGWSTAGDG